MYYLHYMTRQWQTVITTEELKVINEKYLNDIKSLEKTTAWVSDQYGINISRSQLTNAFRAKGLEVRKANGYTGEEYIQINKYRSPISELASAILESTLKDIHAYKYKTTKYSLIHYLSACHLLTTKFYIQLTDTLKSTATWTEDDVESAMIIPYGVMIGGKLIPLDLTLEELQKGSQLYIDQYNLHVGGI